MPPQYFTSFFVYHLVLLSNKHLLSRKHVINNIEPAKTSMNNRP